ncbi:hypothetical protein ABBQ38_003414 [Trebouxia sp. C0009 RCD-2024]
MSALASETGQAVKQTFSDSSISTSGHVQQGRQYHVSSNDHSDLPHNGQADQLVEDIPPSSSPDPKAVQAEIQRVKRKLVSTDAATEVVLRFNFMGSKESKIFTLFLVHAYSTQIWKQQEADNSNVSVAAIEHGFHSPAGHSKLVMDGPWTLLWPCLLLWPWFQAILSFGWIYNATRQPPLLTVFTSSW